MSAISNVIKAVFSTEEKQPLTVEELEIKYKEAGKVWQDLADQLRKAKAGFNAEELRKKYAGKFFSDYNGHAVKVLAIDLTVGIMK